MSDLITRKEAKNLGLRYYFTGKPCKRGHIQKRMVASFSCSSCSAITARAFRKRNPLAANEAAKKWRLSHPEKVKELKAKFDKLPKYKEKQKARSKKHYENNKEKFLASVSAHYKANKERQRIRSRAWKKRNPDNLVENRNKRRARLLRAEGHFTEHEVRELFIKQNGKCNNCLNIITLEKGKSNIANRDHIIALSRGGTNWIINIQLLCHSCNSKKWAHDPVEFARREGRLL